MLSIVTWLWRPQSGPALGPRYVNNLRSMLARNLRIPHTLHCVTDTPAGIDPGVVIVAPPQEYADTPRCRRRMWQWAKERRELWGPRMLAIDLDVVITDDITPLVDRPEPIVMWKVGYAGVYSGSLILADTGALDGAWQAFACNPLGYPKATGEANGSDQAMLNHWLKGRRVAEWTERDGICTWFGNGYSDREHHGIGPGNPQPPKGTRLVVFGRHDVGVMESGAYPWVREAWR